MTPYTQIKKDFANKKILVFGLGILGGGAGAAEFFVTLGSHVTVTDLKTKGQLSQSIDKLKSFPIKFTLGSHDKKDILDSDVILRNPAIPKNHILLKLARQNNIPVYMDAALYAKYTKTPIIGITGTRGKSTTANLIHKIISSAYPEKVMLGGNAVNHSTLELLEKEPSETFISVLELSSWQLQGFADFNISPKYAVLTNIYEDHLNRYPSMTDYIADKKAIFVNQTPEDILFINKSDETLNNITQDAKSEKIYYQASDLPQNLKLKLPGDHNRSNAAAALAVARKLKIDDKLSQRILSQIGSLPYRLQKVRTINNITFINDATSTTPIALITALEAIPGPIILIMGGASKSLPTKELILMLNSSDKIKHIILLPGSGTDEIRSQLEKKDFIQEVSNLKQSVTLAFDRANPGDTVMLSPGFTSFSQFANEFDRGEKFNQFVSEL